MENLPAWGHWGWKDKFLPAEFHQRPSILPMFKLARENWLKMGPDAELVVLSMGLAIRDMHAVQFVEGDEFPEDYPDWVRASPFGVSDANRLMEIWGKQLPADKDLSDHSEEDVDPKGKGKAKASGRKKRKVEPPKDDAHEEETIPTYAVEYHAQMYHLLIYYCRQKRGRTGKNRAIGRSAGIPSDDRRTLRSRDKK